MRYKFALHIIALLIMLNICKGEELPLVPLPNYECEVSIMLGGDVMFHQPQIDAMLNREGVRSVEGSFQYICDSWRECDAVIFNLETTLAEGNYSGYPQFATPKEVAQNLRSCGVTHLMLANNHSCDRYAEGVRNTIRHLDQVGIYHAGCYTDSTQWRQRSPLYINRKGFKIALLNYTYGTNGIPVPKGMVIPHLDTAQMARDIARAKRAFATNIITFLHWGNEYQSTPSSEQRQLAKWLRGNGVDIIVGSHPHVIQPTEVDSCGVIIYSLGNLISNQRKPRTNGGLLVKLDIVRNTLSGRSVYKITHLPHFVYVAPLGDSPRYYCTPESLLDSVVKDAAQRFQASEFFRDTWRLLEKSATK